MLNSGCSGLVSGTNPEFEENKLAFHYPPTGHRPRYARINEDKKRIVWMQLA
jgi:hypothetical protein